MKVSIVVPTYNQGPYIETCLRSIQEQSLGDFEVIIQDSVSKDQTEEICRRFTDQDPRFQYFREKDSGQSDAINRGLARSQGQLWTWICSDDYYSDPRALQALIQRFDEAVAQDSKVVGVYGDAEYVSEVGQKLDPYGNATRTLYQTDFKLTWPLSQPSCLLDRIAVFNVKGVDAALYLGMDLDLFLKVLTHGRSLVYTPQMTVCIRLQPNSKSVMFRKKTAENALSIVKRHFGNPGNPYQSLYAKEYAISQRLEFNHRVKNFFHFLFSFTQPLRKHVFTIEQETLHYLDHPATKHGLRFYFVWMNWCAYAFWKWRICIPAYVFLRKVYNFILEFLFRARGFFTR